MTNLEKLTKEIQSKLPHLMEDVAGQRYERNFIEHELVRIDDKLGLYWLFSSEVKSYYKQELGTKFNVLGLEPKLNDVLFFLFEIGYLINSLKFIQAVTMWDLSKPLLKDQSEELIDYLAQLI